jgi:hypothetical protein
MGVARFCEEAHLLKKITPNLPKLRQMPIRSICQKPQNAVIAELWVTRALDVIGRRLQPQ